MVRRVLTLGVALAVLLSTAACSGGSGPVDGIKLPGSSADFEGEDYQDVVRDLREAGFANVETNPLGDLIVGWLKKDGAVEEVRVDGDPAYSEDTRFPKDIEIVVSYHFFPLDEERPEEAEPVETESSPEPGVRPVSEAEARWLEIMMIDKPLDLLAQDGYDSFAPLHAMQPGWGGSTDGYLRIAVQEPLDAEQVKRLGINVLNLVGPQFRDIAGVIFTDSHGFDHNFFRSEAPGANLNE